MFPLSWAGVTTVITWPSSLHPAAPCPEAALPFVLFTSFQESRAILAQGLCSINLSKMGVCIPQQPSLLKDLDGRSISWPGLLCHKLGVLKSKCIVSQSGGGSLELSVGGLIPSEARGRLHPMPLS